MCVMFQAHCYCCRSSSLRKTVNQLKRHLLVMYEKIQYSGWGLMWNTALGFASCYICHSTSPLILYLPYITRNGALSYTVQLNLNITHVCQYTHVPAGLPHVKLKNLACTCTVAHNFGVHTTVSEHMQHTNDTRHKLALGLAQYMCGVQVQ